MKKILVIEDERSLREDIVEILRYEDYDVYDAENGEKGIQLTKQVMPDLIICDIMMPVLNGYGVLVELRGNPATANIPLIFLTAKTNRADMRRGMVLGADDYLMKPFTQPELIDAINTRFNKQRELEKKYETQLNTLRDNIIRALPHELRTSLTGIIGYAHMLMEDAEILQPTQIHQMAEGIERASHRLYEMTEKYLLYAQLELIEKDTKRQNTMQVQVCEDAHFVIQDAALQTSMKYKRNSDLAVVCEPTTLSLSPDSLEKIVEEIADNSFKFSDKGTRVNIIGRLNGVVYELSFVDEGHGLSAEQIQQIGAYMQFERRIYEQGGLGFGLIIAKKLTEIYRGQLTINSVVEQGTEVVVSLPVHQE